MTDIVERLRHRARVGDGWTRPEAADAADEIERLRAEKRERAMQGLADGLQHTALLEEIERLREVLALGIHMREAQTTYFKTRSKDALVAAKALEAEFLHRARALLTEDGR